MNPIVKLLHSDNEEDRYIGRVALIRKDEGLFLEHVKYDMPYYALDCVVCSVILGEVYRNSVYFHETMIQEMYPDKIKEIGGYQEYKNEYILQEYFDWPPINLNKDGKG